jgi:hypothetical protein
VRRQANSGTASSPTTRTRCNGAGGRDVGDLGVRGRRSVDVQGSDAGALSVGQWVIDAGLAIVGVWPAAMEAA